ncbi:MAG: lipopolysaccharide biosynthesis protein, partial [Chloroflexales bacterium]|nr:lipopolysaccharide biosynthesis protein [Chloroflexales bacterium]
MLTWDDIWRFLRIQLRWWVVLVLATVLASGTAYALVRQQPNYYVAHASLMVGENFQAAAPNEFAFGLSNTLGTFYSELARREVILQPVAEQLQLPFAWQLIADRMLMTSVNQRANLVEIQITDSAPERAAAIAGAVAQRLIAYSPTAPEKIAAQRSAIETQLATTDARIKDADKKLADLQERQQKLDAAIDLKDSQEQIDELQKARDRYQESYSQLLLLSNNTSVNSLSLFESAAVPTAPLPSRRTLTVAVAGLGGLLLAVLAVLLLDQIDDRWRSGRDLRERMGIRDLGRVPPGPVGANTNGAASARERAMREAHTHIMLAAQGQPARMLLVSSPEPSAARSAFSIDLADVFARAGHRVLLVDADLSEAHLTTLVEQNGQAAQPEVTTSMDVWSRWQQTAGGNDFWSRLQITPLRNVRLLSRRPAEGDLPMLVPSLHWPTLVDALKQYADVVIFDGPSLLKGPDAALLAPLVDGVVLTLDPRCDKRTAIVESRERLAQPGARLLGAIVTPSVKQQAPAKPKRRMNLVVQFGPRGGLRSIRLNRISVEAPPATAPRPQGLVSPESAEQPEVVVGPFDHGWVVVEDAAAPLVTPPAPDLGLSHDEGAAPLVTPLVAVDGDNAVVAVANPQPQGKKRAAGSTPRARRKRTAETPDTV